MKNIIAAVALVATTFTATTSFAVDTSQFQCQSDSYISVGIQHAEWALEAAQAVNDMRPDGSPDWSRADWKAYSQARKAFFADYGQTLENFGISSHVRFEKNVYAPLTEVIAELEEELAGPDSNTQAVILNTYDFYIVTLEIIAELKADNANGQNDDEIAKEEGRAEAARQVLFALNCSDAEPDFS